jgi:hypothetical protein
MRSALGGVGGLLRRAAVAPEVDELLLRCSIRGAARPLAAPLSTSAPAAHGGGGAADGKET